MNRTLMMDRRYPLGDYKYITLADTINDIPQELIFNKEFVAAVQFLQTLSIEIAYRKYVELVTVKYPYNMDLEKAIAALEELREQELEKLHGVLNGISLSNGDDKPLEEPQVEK